MKEAPYGWKRSNNGLPYQTTRWKKLRKWILERDQYLCKCDECTKEKRVTVAHEVDHIIPVAKGGDFWDENNLSAINRDCHKKKTKKDQFGSAYGKGRCDINGLPLDPEHHWNKEDA